MLYFLKKVKENTWRYYFTPAYQKYWWYDLQFLRYWVWQTNTGNYFRISKKWIKVLEISFYTCVNHIGMDPEIEWHRQDSLSFWAIFALLLPWQTGKLKFWKNFTKIWRCHHFTHVYQKSWSYDTCFLRYGVQQTSIFFVILRHFLPF